MPNAVSQILPGAFSQTSTHRGSLGPKQHRELQHETLCHRAAFPIPNLNLITNTSCQNKGVWCLRQSGSELLATGLK